MIQPSEKTRDMWRTLAQVGAVPKSRSSHSAAVIGRKYYVLGGEHVPRVPVDDDLYAYDLDANTWSKCEPGSGQKKPAARVGHAATVVGRKMYVFGGRTQVAMGEGCLNDLHCYDSDANTWTEIHATGSIPEARSFHSMTSSGDKVYLFGGCTKDRKNDLFCFDTTSNHWKQLPTYDAIKPRGGPGLVAIGDSIYVVAGFTGKEENDMFKYDINTQQWATLEPNPCLPPISVFGMTAVGKKIVLFGGEVSPSNQGHAGAGDFSNTLYSYDTARPGDGWVVVSTQGELPSPRGWLPAAATDDEVIVFGGNCASNDRLADGYRLQI